MNSPLRVVSLFSGIGGLDLGLELAGMEVVAHSEIDPYASRVLSRHWPCVPNLGDVAMIDWTPWSGKVDVIAGGFPCQDVSVAGKRAGLKEGTRSGLWSEFARAIGAVRPRYVIVENVPGLASSGGPRVVGDLAAAGYVGQVVPLSAADVGAPHLRKRIFIVAHADREQHEGGGASFRWPSPAQFLADAQTMQRPALVGDEPHGDHAGAGAVADSGGQRGAVGREARDVAGSSRGGQGEGHQRERDGDAVDDRRAVVADAQGQRRGARGAGRAASHGEGRLPQGDTVPDPDYAGCEEQRCSVADGTQQPSAERDGWWSSEPNVGRVANGVPRRVDRLRCLGNAVVPQCGYVIGRIVIGLEAQFVGETQ